MFSFQSKLTLVWKYGMDMEENFSMEWKKIASMEYGKIVLHSIPYHALIMAPLIFKIPFWYLPSDADKFTHLA